MHRGIKTNWEVPKGPTARRIVEYAGEDPGTLVVMATHGRSGLKRWVLGSVTEEVVRETGAPVLVIRP